MVVLCMMGIAGLILTGSVMGEEQVAAAGTNEVAKVKPQTTCPVMKGEAINKKIFSDYKGKRVYFCCKACPKMFAKDPDKYMKRMKEEGITLEDAPKTDKSQAAGEGQVPAKKE